MLEPNFSIGSGRDGKLVTGAHVLLDWYDCHHRVLPWRKRAGEPIDPYFVWLSEVMLQQTTVKAVIPYFFAFTERWPNVAALAAAPDSEIMAAWAGLGYYSRARKLIACARDVVKRFDGQFPQDERNLLSLPGIGPYSAAAIAAIAFQKRAVVIDGNVERVIARRFRIETPLPAAKRAIYAFADQLTPDNRAGDYAQAVMDLGATICTPRNPTCTICPWMHDCASKRHGDAERFPLKIKKASRPTRHGIVYVVQRGDMVLVTRRPPQGLLGGMTVFPGASWMSSKSETEEPPLAHLDWRVMDGTVGHVFTHFALSLTVKHAQAPSSAMAPPGHWWAKFDDLSQVGLPSVMSKVANHPAVVILLQAALSSRKERRDGQCDLHAPNILARE